MALVISFDETYGTDGGTALEAKQILDLGGMRGTGRELRANRRRRRREIRGDEGRIVGLCDVDDLVALCPLVMNLLVGLTEVLLAVQTSRRRVFRLVGRFAGIAGSDQRSIRRARSLVEQIPHLVELIESGEDETALDHPFFRRFG